ncbi:MAG: uroporphyrinogen decarboxylase family protein [bacterium]
MHPRERIERAIRCLEPDRVPVVIMGVDPFAERPVWTTEDTESYRPLIDYVRDHCDIEHRWGFDRGIFLSATEEIETHIDESERDEYILRTHTVETPKGPLSSITRISKGESFFTAPVKHFVESPGDVEKVLSVPYKPVLTDLSSFFREEERVGDAGVVKLSFGDPILEVHSLMGSELLSLWSVERRDLIVELLKVFFERLRDQIEYILKGGVHPGYIEFLGPEVATPPLLSPKDFEDFVFEYDKPLVELVKGYGIPVSIHCHGRIDAVLERFLEMGIDALHPVEAPPMGDVELAEAKHRVDGRICIRGNIQIGDIYTCTKDEIADKCKAAIRDAAPGGGFILVPTASPYERHLSAKALENYIALIDTALKCGEYPLDL